MKVDTILNLEEKDYRFEGMSKKKKVVLGSIGIFVLTVFLACAYYLNDYYKANAEAITTFEVENEVIREVAEDGTIVYMPEKYQQFEDEADGNTSAVEGAGIIFYPGGKVEHTAYEPLMKELASEGILCVLVEMPFRLAVFDMNAADGIKEKYPKVTNWYMGGHSLGGSMAAAYLGEHNADYEGLILLGSYSTEDLSGTSLKVLSVYGSEDKVLNVKNYRESKNNLPADFTEVVLDGGCHAYFGMYGAQEGDGAPTISNEEQIRVTADAIMQFVE